MLHKLTRDQAFVDQVATDYREADLDAKMRAILDYAVKLTLKPSDVTNQDIAALKNTGCTDREILDACQVTSYFNFVNRMAEGLKVELELED